MDQENKQTGVDFARVHATMDKINLIQIALTRFISMGATNHPMVHELSLARSALICGIFEHLEEHEYMEPGPVVAAAALLKRVMEKKEET